MRIDIIRTYYPTKLIYVSKCFEPCLFVRLQFLYKPNSRRIQYPSRELPIATYVPPAPKTSVVKTAVRPLSIPDPSSGHIDEEVRYHYESLRIFELTFALFAPFQDKIHRMNN